MARRSKVAQALLKRKGQKKQPGETAPVLGGKKRLQDLKKR